MNPNTKAINVTALNKSFGNKKILDNLCFNVPTNAIAGFLGPNGAGKTTTLRMILGLLPSSKGNIELLGHKIPEDRTAALERIGAVVENPSFIETMSAEENLYWFGNLYKAVEKKRILEVIDMVGLKEATKQKFGTFSTGMKQRLGVAFGLLHKPELLILDEPTSGMDPAGRFQMREILLNIHEQEKTSIFLSSHLLDEVQKLCNYVVIINKGQTITEGYVSDILSSKEERYEIRVADNDIERTKAILEATQNIVKSMTLAPRGFIVDLENDSSSKINEILVKAGIMVQALIPLESSLEETFMRLTNKGKESQTTKGIAQEEQNYSFPNKETEKTQIHETIQEKKEPIEKGTEENK